MGIISLSHCSLKYSVVDSLKISTADLLENFSFFKPLSANPTKWSNTPKLFTIFGCLNWAGWKIAEKY